MNAQRIQQLCDMLEFSYPQTAARFQRVTAEADKLGRLNGKLEGAAQMRAALLPEIEVYGQSCEQLAGFVDELGRLVDQHLPGLAAKCEYVRPIPPMSAIHRPHNRDSTDWKVFAYECRLIRASAAAPMAASAETSDDIGDPIDVKTAAKILEVTESRVRQLIRPQGLIRAANPASKRPTPADPATARRIVGVSKKAAPSRERAFSACVSALERNPDLKHADPREIHQLVLAELQRDPVEIGGKTYRPPKKLETFKRYIREARTARR